MWDKSEYNIHNVMNVNYNGVRMTEVLVKTKYITLLHWGAITCYSVCYPNGCAESKSQDM